MPRVVWVRSDHLPTYDERKKMVSSALESGYVEIVVREEDKELKRIGRVDAIVLRGKDLILDEEKIGELVEVRSPEDLAKAMALKDKVESVLIEAKDWKVIPLENLIADFQRSKTRLIATAHTPEDAKLFFETLEVGVGGVALTPSSPARTTLSIRQSSKWSTSMTPPSGRGRAARAVRAQTIATVSSLPPNPPPTGVPTISTAARSTPRNAATKRRVLNGCCMPPYTSITPSERGRQTADSGSR